MTHAAAPPITLRPWGPQDRRAVLEIFSTTDDLGTQYPLPVKDLDDADDVLKRMLVWDTDSRNLAVTVNGGPVGNVAVAVIDRRHDTGWMSYFSAGKVRGRGLVRNSAIAVANWALSGGVPGGVSLEGSTAGSTEGSTAGSTVDGDLRAGLGLYRLELGHRVNNPASGRIAIAAGFVQEGREREKLRYGNERFDTLAYGRLATDPIPLAPNVTLQI